MTPKATYYDLILQSKELMSTTLFAKDYGLSAFEMNKLLHDMKIQYKLGSGQWIIYQNYAKEGYTKTKTDITKSGVSITYTCWTQKGRLFLYEQLKKQRGLLPCIERTDD